MTGKSQDKPIIRDSRNKNTDRTQILVLLNDDINSFDFVIKTLIEICSHSGIQAEQCAMLAHYTGKCEIKKGDFEELKEIQSDLVSRGLTSMIE